MAAAGQSKRPSGVAQRRNQQARDSATQERVTLIALGVLVAVLVLVGAGVVWGIILPPRAHIVTVGNKAFNAQDVEARAEFMVAGNSQSTEDPVAAAITQLKRDETLLEMGPSEIGDVTADDISKAIRKQLGSAEASDADFAKAYATFLKGTNLDKPTYERMIRAQVIEERLSKKFQGELGDTGPQMHIMGVTSRDQGKLKQFRDAVAGGADFITTAISSGFAKQPSEVDFGWQILPTSGFLKDTVHINDLKAGTTTDVIPREGALQFDVYRLDERDDKRTFTDSQKTELAKQKVDAWIVQQGDKVKANEDLSDGERNWIVKRLTKAVQRIAQQRAADPLNGLPPGVSTTATVPGK